MISSEKLMQPPHEPCVLPVLLAKQGLDMIIAWGMGSRAQQYISGHASKFIVGAASYDPRDVSH